ncbi:MAG: hypothetical protein JNK26_03775 [Candidatus Doudnabacteria bacterium]|nr:hypothetical protein [Candidatus Doudnabacteria bacterium]
MKCAILIVENDELHQELLGETLDNVWPQIARYLITGRNSLTNFIAGQDKDTVYITILDHHISGDITGQAVAIELINNGFQCLFIGNSDKPENQPYLINKEAHLHSKSNPTELVNKLQILIPLIESLESLNLEEQITEGSDLNLR